MNELICQVGGCDRNHLARGFCRGHYQRVKRNGHPGSGYFDNTEYPEICTIDGCEDKYKSVGYCNAHYLKFRKYGDPEFNIDRGGSNHPMWLGDDVGYFGVHQRLSNIRGLAKENPCYFCGQEAKHWSYTYQDPNEKSDKEFGLFSIDLRYYVPLCVPCHRKYDFLHTNLKDTTE